MDYNRPRLSIIGAGRVGSTLAIALQQCGYHVVSVSSRSIESAQQLAAKLNCPVASSAWEAATSAELTLLTVPDDVIAEVCQEIAQAGDLRSDLTGHAVVHTSGVSDMSVLASAKAKGAWVGGLHPMLAIMDREHSPSMTFSSPSTASKPDVTFGVEAESEPLRTWLADIVSALNGIPLWLHPGHDRARYHAAGVIASNYMVTLFAEATELLQSLNAGGDERQLGQIIVQLLEKTLANIKSVGAVQALTGPVVRGDAGTVQKHLDALRQTDPELAEIYRLLAKRSLRIAALRGLSQEKLHGIKSVLGEISDANIHNQYSEDEA